MCSLSLQAILSIMEKSNEGQVAVDIANASGPVRRVTRSQSQPSPEPPPANIINRYVSSFCVTKQFQNFLYYELQTWVCYKL